MSSIRHSGGRGNENLFAASRSLEQDGRHPMVQTLQKSSSPEPVGRFPQNLICSHPNHPGAMWPGPFAIPASLVPCDQILLPFQPFWRHVARPCCHPSLPGAMWPCTVAIQATLVPCCQSLLPSKPTWCHVARPCCHPSLPGAMWPGPVDIPATLVPCGQAM